MSKLKKEIKRSKLRPKDFTLNELKTLLSNLGFYEDNKGKTSGSRIAFINKNNVKIELHKPHPQNFLKQYQIDIILNKLKEMEEFRDE